MKISAASLRFLFLLALAGVMVRAQEAQTTPPATPREKQTTTGTISGRVLGDDGRPIAGAAVSFLKVHANTPGPPRSVSTDIEGKFSASGLTTGLYQVYAISPGFVSATDSASDPNEVRYYRPGDSANLTLVKGGVITGTVRDANGEPVVAVLVRVLRVRDSQGRSLPRTFSQFRMTDDRGVYRIYGLQAGTYIVSAGGGVGFYMGTNAYESDAPTFYPSSTRDTAAEIPVRTGEEATGIDIRYRNEPGHTVSGTISGSIDSANRIGISVSLRQVSGGYEMNTFVAPNAKLAFSLSGVADGVYELLVQQGSSAGETVASTPRRITVKGSDVTGIELMLAPLASIAGRVHLEPKPKEGCVEERAATLPETAINARRDDKEQTQDILRNPFSASVGIPTEQGEFTIRSLTAGSYRLGAWLPGEEWYVRSITLPVTLAAKPADAKSAASTSLLSLKTGERVTGVVMQIAQDAAGLRGRVMSAAEGEEAAAIPANLRVHLVPAERERAEDVLRYSETAVGSDGSFALKNLAPGRYFLLARNATESELAERPARQLAWNAEARSKLRREAEGANNAIELKPCQRVNDHLLRYPNAKPAP